MLKGTLPSGAARDGGGATVQNMQQSMYACLSGPVVLAQTWRMQKSCLGAVVPCNHCNDCQPQAHLRESCPTSSGYTHICRMVGQGARVVYASDASYYCRQLPRPGHHV